MNEWFEALRLIEQIFFFVALPASVLLVLQAVMTLLGVINSSDAIPETQTETDFDADIDADFDADIDVGDIDIDGEINIERAGRLAVKASNMKLLSVRSLIALCAVGGWTGFALGDQMHPAWVIILALGAGFLAALVVAFLYHRIEMLTSDGTLRLYNAIDRIGEVYLPIGANGKGQGKIVLDVQGRMVEMDAVTRADCDLPVGTAVRVVGLKSEDVAIVAPEKNKKPLKG